MHGWGCTLELWQALGFLSSLRGRACIAVFDMRGSGRSSCGRALWRTDGLGEDALVTTLVGISQFVPPRQIKSARWQRGPSARTRSVLPVHLQHVKLR